MGVEGIAEFMQKVDWDRNKRWIDVSIILGAIDPFLMVTIQGLGRLDARLVAEDEHLVSGHGPSNPSGDVSEHLTYSYLWVLGTYEVIRTLSQRMREDSHIFPTHKDDVARVKALFARIRMPLAKFEAATKHKDTDSHIAYPCLNTKLGISWQLTPDHFVVRRELSDAFLELLEKLKAHP